MRPFYLIVLDQILLVLPVSSFALFLSKIAVLTEGARICGVSNIGTWLGRLLSQGTLTQAAP